MSKVVVLGGCGAVGSVAVRTLAGHGDWSEIVIGDIDLEKAESIVAELGDERLRAHRVDATDAASVTAAVKGSDIVLNCVGPFYKSVKTILGAVLDLGINYIDVCDDVDVTLEILDPWIEKTYERMAELAPWAYKRDEAIAYPSTLIAPPPLDILTPGEFTTGDLDRDTSSFNTVTEPGEEQL